nr:PQQ-dependent sugar dehydrogenase [uncultured Allomuricauda sp.]
MNKLIFPIILLCIGCAENHKKSVTEEFQPFYPIKEVVLDSLNHPWSIAFISNNEALVSEKDGNLLSVNLSTKEKRTVKGFPSDLTDSIRAIHFGDNSGIFEVLVDPNFKKNKWVYISYSAKKDFGTTTKVVRAQLNNNSLINHQTLIEAAPYTREYYHYGGGMTFGADGKLYVTIGERLFWERDEPPLPIAQDVTDKRGKIYRINPDGSIPDDNPNLGPNAIPGVYAMGIRAAQGITVQPDTNTIWFSEHGTIQGDEINILKPGANYGWPNVTSGKLRSSDYTPPQLEGVDFTPPVWFWQHTVAPTGLTFYTGTEFPQWKNNLIVPGLSRGSLWRFKIDNETIKSAEELFLDDRVRIRKARQSPDGKLYILTDEDNGKIIEIKSKKNVNSKS